MQRWFPRFSIRACLLLTLLAALPPAWYAHNRREWRQEQAALAQLPQEDRIVHQFPIHRWLSQSLDRVTVNVKPAWTQRAPRSMRKVFQRVVRIEFEGSPISSTQLEILGRFKHLEHLSVIPPLNGFSTLQPLQELPALRSLTLREPFGIMTPELAAELAALPHVEHLTVVVNAGCEHVQTLRELRPDLEIVVEHWGKQNFAQTPVSRNSNAVFACPTSR